MDIKDYNTDYVYTQQYMHAYTNIIYEGKEKTTTCIIAALDNLLNCTMLPTSLQSPLWLLSEKQSERRTELSPKDNMEIKQTLPEGLSLIRK